MADALPAQVDGVRFSATHGFYSAAFDLTLTNGDDGGEIRFTLDGSAPTASQGLIYTAPISISQTSVVRAAAFNAGGPPSNVVTQTYIFLDDVIRQSPNGAPPPGWPVGPINGQVFDYGMDPDIVNGSEADLKAALLAIPTVSLVTDMAHLVDPATGIYVNAGQHGIAWERPVSVELLNDPLNAANGFQVNGGLRIRGNFSRADDNPKHAFRLFFRAEYGATELRYAVFGIAGTDEFDGIDIQCPQDFSWSYLGDSRNNFLREVWFRDTQRDLGQPHPRGRFVHLYLNGSYWGLYQIEERPEASFAETYLGGDKDDYDVIKTTGQAGGYTIEATDGVLRGPTGQPSAYEQLWQKSRAHFSDPTNARYFAISGLAADGVTPIADPVLLDIDNLIDYMLTVFFGGNADSPLSDVLGNTLPNNFYCARSRAGTRGFTYFFHDAEMSLDFSGLDYDRTGPFINSGSTSFSRSNPQYTHQDLLPNGEYKVRFGDRVHRAMFNGGALTPVSALARLGARAGTVRSAILGESARWGDAQRPSDPFTVADWEAARSASSGWLSQRHPIVLQQLRGDGLYPQVVAPKFSQHGGEISSGAAIVMTEATTPIFFTMDGSDPRLVGGGLNPAARETESATVATETLVGHPSDWRYLDDGSTPPANWASASFDPATWLAGIPNSDTETRTRTRRLGSAPGRIRTRIKMGHDVFPEGVSGRECGRDQRTQTRTQVRRRGGGVSQRLRSPAS